MNLKKIWKATDE